nr:cytochrome P450 [Streptomyces boncukensis]
MSAAATHGPAVELTPGTVLLSDPAAVHEVLRRTNTDFLVAADLRRDELSGHRDDPGTDAWMQGRRAVRKGMAPPALRAHRDWLTARAERLAARWRERGTVPEAVRELEDFSARSFARFCFGTREASAAPERTGALLDALVPVMASPFQLPRALRRFLPRYRRSVSAQRALESELRRLLAAPGEGGLVDALAEAGLDTDTTVRVLVAMGLASYRVPAAAAAWSLVALARHPGTADACAAAAGAEAGPAGEPPDIVAWTRAETLRLWPPTWLLQRAAHGPQTCGGWRIPPDATVLISPYVLHRTAPVFADPLEFRPERWADLRPGAGEYLPYGIGSRWCVGKPLADLGLAVLLSVLGRELRFTVERIGELPDVRTTMLPSRLVLGAGAR